MGNPMRAIASIALLAAAAAAQPRARDIEGWDQVKWGMPLDQVRALYQVAGESSTQSWTHLQLPAIRVGDIPLEVDVAARKPGDQVTLIALWCSYGAPAGPRGSAPRLAPGDFDTLKEALFRKYGSPRDETRSTEHGDPATTLLWVFPSGSITLKRIQNRRIPAIGSFRIEYRAAEKAPL